MLFQKSEYISQSGKSTANRLGQGCGGSRLSKKNPLDPQVLLMTILSERTGINMDTILSHTLPPDYFPIITEQNILDYSIDIVSAVRREDMQLLEQFKSEGRNFECRNKCGDSLMHIACRRGAVDVVRFLLESGCTARVQDDFGRTPFHDALWLPDPKYELLELLIDHDASMLLAKDKRGFYPFAYAPKDHWDKWVDFIGREKDHICSKLTVYDKNK